MEQKNVKIYTTPSCFWCSNLKTFLNLNNIQYTDIDISRSEEAVKEMISKSGKTSVPQTEIDGQIIVGFSQEKIKELLGLN